MARIARVVVPGYPHHVTQRGARRQATFFCNRDYRAYLQLLMAGIAETGVAIWGYCLMPNHVHLIAVPGTPRGLAQLFRAAHQRYSLTVNERQGWRGHLWQERFHSFVMDDAHLLLAARYIELNPVRAGLCRLAIEWPWSSVHAHLAGKSDGIVDPQPLLQRVGNWEQFIDRNVDQNALSVLRAHGRTGRPAGSPEFISQLELSCGRRLRRRKPGRRPELGELSP
jgi:putative transposase